MIFNPPALQMTNLRKTYRGRVTALRGVSLTVQEGDFFALLGPNGAGKSTAIGIISSLVLKTAGEIKIFGVDVDKEFSRAKSLIGVVPQEINFNQFETVNDIILNQAGYYGIDRPDARKRTEKILKQTQLWDRRDEISRNLSGGMKRRLMISRALIHEPRLLILDEPTAGVDIEVRRSMWKFLTDLNKSGTTIILTTHYLEEAESLCRNIAIIDKGEIVENTSMQLLLRKLGAESFIFDCSSSISTLSKLGNHQIQKLDDHRFEVTVNQGENLNTVFEELSKSGIKIQSMRNKSNRLEELFLGLVAESA
ncbi:MAG: ABC transporter ATP-binding protein [Proteobacteria bacterium]|nr:ABC transporter ATP-binding protein [Pseudomonadota bacterium]MBT5066265.1 ABC transporter ATP-binding protein [Pseudomonadota bacterium]MBT6192126.1 ABC transporter ATP-binding protein [Pseudomonadota bacterium]MBT6465849.1 ABC transporter ATP-binding protein [Pseudomonadota bacterium]MBT7245432.1 ABC transporter ATP-binding protein [Pseudomonadota bacterium]